MSSEESAEEEDNDHRPVLLVKTLPWRSAQVSKVFKALDEKAEKCKSKRAKMQTLERFAGSVSQRLKPTPEFGSTFWGFSQYNLQHRSPVTLPGTLLSCYLVRNTAVPLSC